MRAFLTAAALCGVFSLPASAFAADTSRRNPYQNLFRAQMPSVQSSGPRATSPVPQFALPQGAPAAGAQIICGMTVMQGDSKIDPGMVQKVPANGVKPLITAIEPGICKR